MANIWPSLAWRGAGKPNFKHPCSDLSKIGVRFLNEKPCKNPPKNLQVHSLKKCLSNSCFGNEKWNWFVKTVCLFKEAWMQRPSMAVENKTIKKRGSSRKCTLHIAHITHGCAFQNLKGGIWRDRAKLWHITPRVP